jgi:hypothetical protein
MRGSSRAVGKDIDEASVKADATTWGCLGFLCIPVGAFCFIWNSEGTELLPIYGSLGLAIFGIAALIVSWRLRRQKFSK